MFLSARLLPFKYSLHSCMSPASALCHTTLKLSSSICLSIYLCLFTTEKYLYQSVHLSVRLSIHLSFLLTICPFTHCLFIYSISLCTIRISIRPCIFLLSIHPSIYPSVLNKTSSLYIFIYSKNKNTYRSVIQPIHPFTCL